MSCVFEEIKKQRKPEAGFEPALSSLPRPRFTEGAFDPESGYLCCKRPLCVLLISIRNATYKMNWVFGPVCRLWAPENDKRVRVSVALLDTS